MLLSTSSNGMLGSYIYIYIYIYIAKNKRGPVLQINERCCCFSYMKKWARRAFM